MDSLSVPTPTHRPPRWRRITYWILLACSWLVFVPNALHIEIADGFPSPLWILSPIFGLGALMMALLDKSWIRGVLALLFGVGAAWIGFVVTVMLFGP